MANVFRLLIAAGLLYTAYKGYMYIKVLIEFYDKVMKDVFLIFYSMLGEDDPQNSFYEDALSYAQKHVIVGFVTVAAVRVILAVILSIIGFTPDGIAAGSLAATLMSIAAIANGGFLLAGTLVPMLQSAGAVGLGFRAQLGIGMAVTLIYWYFT